MNKRSTMFRLAPWLLAVVLLAAQTLALAHEIKHDLRQHDDASCVLHLHSKHHGQAATAMALSGAIVPHAAPVLLAVTQPRAVAPLGYRTRAPPLFS